MARTARSQEVMDWRAAIVAGLIAGTVALVVQSLLYAVFAQGSTWVTLRYLAALALGEPSLPPPAAFEFTTALVGAAVGLATSVAFTLIVAFIVHRWRLLISTIGGMILGFALYLINSYLMAAPFPWLSFNRGWIVILSYVLFGGLAGFVYESLERDRSEIEAGEA